LVAGGPAFCAIPANLPALPTDGTPFLIFTISPAHGLARRIRAPARDTYYGQWRRENAANHRLRFRFHCPRSNAGSAAFQCRSHSSPAIRPEIALLRPNDFLSAAKEKADGKVDDLSLGARHSSGASWSSG